MSDEPQAPRRLLQTVGPAGDCVREALAERELPQVPPRFAVLQERRLQRVRRQRALSLLALVAVARLGARLLQHDEPPSNIRAELSAGPRNQPPVASNAASAPLNEQPLATESATQSPLKIAPQPAALKPATARASSEAQSRSSADPVAKPTSPADEAGGSAKACAQLASAGSPEQALACYEKLANSSGMTAELALFEQARLEGKVLRHPERALLTLSAYRRRFPQGSLRAEVMLAQIDWLLAAGDAAQARAVVDEALASGLLRERSAELERLRATLPDAHE